MPPPRTCAKPPPRRTPRSRDGRPRPTTSAPRSCARSPRETGGIEPKAGFEVQMVVSILHRSAAMCTEPQGLMLPSDGGRLSLARRVPRGVIGVISPFNFPLILSSRAVAPALATGNAVVLKPDPRTALTGGFIIARLFEEAGLPKGARRRRGR